VYTENGIVSDIQRQDPIRARAAVRCPSPIELRDAQVSANALSAGEGATERYKSLLRQQRECRH
jgi:hypothetical protein